MMQLFSDEVRWSCTSTKVRSWLKVIFASELFDLFVRLTPCLLVFLVLTDIGVAW